MKPSNGSGPTFSPATSVDRTRLIVGIGASAGGIDAFQSFFARMSADTGMAFVLIQHLDPNHDSSLVAIIAGYTAMPVHLAEGGEQICPNHVYVIPPNTILTIKSNVLHLDSPAPHKGTAMPQLSCPIRLSSAVREGALLMIRTSDVCLFRLRMRWRGGNLRRAIRQGSI
ncbi:chemotaxis protein CheB [Geminicoccus harenae]|uniref:chemotaxis protein CheB n=1 Tax=Geminicoccus harenae TaxID=2498453 RepID=UPI00168A4AD7|nr:chemotaxis protein CheB [Geminicoccus harenae]